MAYQAPDAEPYATLCLVSERSALPTTQVVWGAALLMIAGQVAFRGWALHGSWFHTDDYRLLDDAQTSHVTWSYLVSPFDSQLMPWGRAVAWAVAHSGHVDWSLASTITLGLQALAGVACLGMLVTLFGARWGVLAPLGLYLSSAITMPALMWWAASLNQLPLQVAFFTAVACWVRYARSRRLAWLALTLVAVGVGLLAYVKSLLILGVLAYLLLAYFSEGGPLRRVGGALRRYWPAAVSAVALAGLYLGYYTSQVPSILTRADGHLATGLADRLLRISLATGVVGGPWRWGEANAPAVSADPPPWAVHLTWLLLALVALWCVIRWRRTGRAWLLLAGYAGAVYALVLTTRAPVVGSGIGLEYRYLTDAVPVLALCLGLATMPLCGARQTIEARRSPVLPAAWGPWLVGGVAGAVCVSGLVSSASYADVWHHRNAGADWTRTAMAGLTNRGILDFADQPVPVEVVPAYSAPYNTTGRLLPLLAGNARFPEVTTVLHVVDHSGNPREALIDAASTSSPGPVAGCGWKAEGGPDRAPTAVALGAPVPAGSWWIRVGYLATADDTMTVYLNGAGVEVPVLRGLHNAFLHHDGPVTDVSVGGLTEGTTVCVDPVEVGIPVPGVPE